MSHMTQNSRISTQPSIQGRTSTHTGSTGQDRPSVLVALTNTTRYGATGKPTGLWLSEATEFVEQMQQHGIAVDYVSPKGGFVPLDPRSMRYVNDGIMEVYASSDFRERALAHSLSPAQIDPARYDAIYFTGGHGVMWDFPENTELQNIARSIYTQGGFLTSVCHGIAGLLNIRDDHGGHLITGKQITGFTTAEEILAGKIRVVPFLNERAAQERGAHFVKKLPYTSFAVRDGRFITGQNPFSATAVATQLIGALSDRP